LAFWVGRYPKENALILSVAYGLMLIIAALPGLALFISGNTTIEKLPLMLIQEMSNPRFQKYPVWSFDHYFALSIYLTFVWGLAFISRTIFG